MSTQLPSVRLLTRKEQLYVKARLAGSSQQEGLRRAGLPTWMHTRELKEVEALVVEATAALAEVRYAECLVDAHELHEQVTDELRGDIADLYDDAGELRPIKEWPLWARQGGVEVIDEPNMVHSADGGGGSWDAVGRRIKIKSVSRAKAREFAANLKAVDAMVQQKQGNELHLHLHQQVTEKLQGALQREALLIETTASEPDPTP